MDTYALHMALAAMLGASFMAVSAYYMHRRTLTQILEFAKTVERERDGSIDGEEGAESGESPRHFKKHAERRRSHGRRRGTSYSRRTSNSLPDVTAIAGEAQAEVMRNGPSSVDDRYLPIPAGLPRLRKLPEGMPSSNFSPE